MAKCEKCGYEIRAQNVKKHSAYCNGSGPRSAQPVNDENECKFCGKSFPRRSLGGHIGRCDLNPKKVDFIEKMKKPRASLSEAHKQNISKSRTAYLIANPDQVPYRLNHSSKRSNPEITFEKELVRRGITGWVAEYQQSIYTYDFAFTELKIDVEVDGATHMQDKVKQIDVRRDEYSRSLGWKVVRFTAADVKKNVTECVDRLLKEMGV